jgi:hypothetical protein
MNPRGLSVLCWALLLLAGCPSNEPELAQPQGGTEQAQAAPEGLLSSVHMADPRAIPQLLEGFHALEQGAWRWTARKFSVALLPPPGATQQAQLELKFSIPDAVIARLQTVSLTARVNGVEVGSETYDKPGEYTLTKPVPASALQVGEAVKAEFELDKALPPGEADKRELGVVALSVALK